MAFKPGDRVVHKSDKRPRKMVVLGQVKQLKKLPAGQHLQELIDIDRIADDWYICTWISGTKKGQDFFQESEIELQK